MSRGTTRRMSDTERSIRKPDGATRHWLAIGLLSVAIAFGWWLFSRDTDWEARRRQALALGYDARGNSDFESARRHFENALSIQPYDWTTHLALAEVLFHYLNDNTDSLRHYLHAMAYAPENADTRGVTDDIDVLHMMRAGFLEDPFYAVEDMLLAVEAGAKNSFYQRLSAKLREDFPAYWEGWMRRGRGVVSYRNIRREQGGSYLAVVTLSFPDQSSMSMHLNCMPREPWRLSLSFP